MKKWKRLFSLVCAFAMIFSLNATAFAAELPKTDTKQQYEITVGDEVITLEEGEVVEIPMTLIENDESGIQPSSSSQTIVGNAGTLKVWGSGHYLNWSIVMTVPVTHFVGTVSSTDITSGLSAGTTAVTGFSGKCYCARISGHTYVAHLDGIAYLGTVAVAKTGFNTVSWKP
jgi:hypothetical protein